MATFQKRGSFFCFVPSVFELENFDRVHIQSGKTGFGENNNSAFYKMSEISGQDLLLKEGRVRVSFYKHESSTPHFAQVALVYCKDNELYTLEMGANVYYSRHQLEVDFVNHDNLQSASFVSAGETKEVSFIEAKTISVTLGYDPFQIIIKHLDQDQPDKVFQCIVDMYGVFDLLAPGTKARHLEEERDFHNRVEG